MLKNLRGSTRAVAATAAALVVAGAAWAGGSASADNAVPRTDREVPNIDLAKNRVKAYYGDTVDANGGHWASADSNYAKQVERIEAGAERYLASAAHRGGRGGKKPAIVLDMDDTTLLTYNFEIGVNFAFDPVKQDEYLRTTDMPAVFGMPKLVNRAAELGYTVFFLTGRGESQRAWSVRNLENTGYKVPLDESHVYLKYAATPPPYLSCATAKCTTTEYKSGTRKHIESLGYDVVANFGDQYSDLNGGFAEKTFKLPNPMYYLP